MDDIINEANVLPTSNDVNQTDSDVNLDALFNGEPVQNADIDSMQNQEFEIDERFKSLDPKEGQFRTIQSKYDKITADYNKLLANYATVEERAKLVDQMYEDKNLLYAIVNEIDPALVNKPDIKQIATEKLKAEFGDFKPMLSREEAERDDPFGRDAQYYARVDELRKQLITTANKPTSIKEYREKQLREKQELENKQRAEVANVQKKYNATEERVQSVIKFFNSLDLDKAFQVYTLLTRQPQTKANLNLISGTPTTGKSRAFMEFEQSFKQ